MASRWVRGPEKAFNDEQMLELATFLITRTAKKLIAALDSVKALFACKICSMAALKSAKEWMIKAAEGAAIHEIPEPFDGLVERISDSVPL